MTLIRGKFIDPAEAIKQNADPIALDDLARKNYVDTEVGTKQDYLGTGTTLQFLRGDLTWQAISTS